MSCGEENSSWGVFYFRRSWFPSGQDISRPTNNQARSQDFHALVGSSLKRGTLGSIVSRHALIVHWYDVTHNEMILILERTYCEHND